MKITSVYWGQRLKILQWVATIGGQLKGEACVWCRWIILSVTDCLGKHRRVIRTPFSQTQLTECRQTSNSHRAAKTFLNRGNYFMLTTVASSSEDPYIIYPFLSLLFSYDFRKCQYYDAWFHIIWLIFRDMPQECPDSNWEKEYEMPEGSIRIETISGTTCLSQVRIEIWFVTKIDKTGIQTLAFPYIITSQDQFPYTTVCKSFK